MPHLELAHVAYPARMVTPRRMAQSRTVPIEPDRAFPAVLTAELPQVICRRFGPFPPVREVRDQPPSWGQVGQTRTIVTSDGGTMREELTVVEAPHRFGYRLDRITGPMKPLVHGLDGRWTFAPVGTGVRITWEWTLHPRTAAAALTMPLIARLWPPYAARVLERIEEMLLDA